MNAIEAENLGKHYHLQGQGPPTLYGRINDFFHGRKPEPFWAIRGVNFQIKPGGVVGINVGIPGPLGIFGFTGHKNSFFGDLHCMGTDGFKFFTETKNVTATWFTEDGDISTKVDTWDGTITSLPDEDDK